MKRLWPSESSRAFKLTADSRLRKMKLLAGLFNTDFASHHPKIEEMMIIQPFHR
jgi:hypothetical protein